MINFLPIALISALILYIGCTNLLPFLLEKKYKFFIFSYAFLVTFFLCPIIGQAATPITILGVQIIIMFSNSRRILNVCSSLFGYALTIVTNYLVLVFLNYQFGLSITLLQNHYAIVFSLLFAVFTYLITSALKWLLWKKARLQDLEISNRILFFILLNLIMCVIIFMFNFVSGEKLGYPPNVTIFNSILFIAYFIFTSVLLFFVVKSITKEEKTKFMLSQFDTLQDYTNKIESLYMEMRTFKHDYVNILSTLSCYIDNQDLDGLKNYFSKEIIPLNQSFDQSNTKLGLLSNIKMLELKSLLYTKMIYAISNHLDVYLDVAEPIESISMKVVDLTRIIGIFLDNAIESSMETQQRQLQLGIIKKEQSILIVIKNSCIPEQVHLSRIYDSGYSTKGSNRGIGLYSVKQILSNYENIIHSTALKDYNFTQQIEIL